MSHRVGGYTAAWLISLIALLQHSLMPGIRHESIGLLQILSLVRQQAMLRINVPWNSCHLFLSQSCGC